MSNQILILSDNKWLILQFKSLIDGIEYRNFQFHFAYSFYNKTIANDPELNSWVKPLNVKTDAEKIIGSYQLLISLHCKQIFPSNLVHGIKCINVHPGINPHNRGWFPQVFSIINGLPAGATIHEIDEQLDHGPIIAQKEIKLEKYDTSDSAYLKIQQAELELLQQHLLSILNNNYHTKIAAEGNVNLKSDFDELCKLNLNSTGTLQEHINLLRALTHKPYSNGWFLDENGDKIFVSVDFKKSNSN